MVSSPSQLALIDAGKESIRLSIFLTESVEDFREVIARRVVADVALNSCFIIEYRHQLGYGEAQTRRGHCVLAHRACASAGIAIAATDHTQRYRCVGEFEVYRQCHILYKVAHIVTEVLAIVADVGGLGIGNCSGQFGQSDIGCV